jgi:hypothetical protein
MVSQHSYCWINVYTDTHVHRKRVNNRSTVYNTEFIWLVFVYIRHGLIFVGLWMVSKKLVMGYTIPLSNTTSSCIKRGLLEIRGKNLLLVHCSLWNVSLHGWYFGYRYWPLPPLSKTQLPCRALRCLVYQSFRVSTDVQFTLVSLLRVPSAL